MGRTSQFRTVAGRDGYCALYDEAVGQAPVPVEELDLDGRYGVTHVLAAGDPAAPPVVALHAKALSATMWLPLLPALAASRRVYLVDAVGDLNKSVASRVLSSTEHVVSWIDETLDALGLDVTALVGASIGAWMATCYTLAHPERVERLALIGPAGLVSRPHARWMLYAFDAGKIRPGLDRITTFVDSMAMPTTAPRLREDPWRPVVQQFIQGTPTFRSRMNEPLPRLADLDALAAGGIPVEILVGAQESLHDGRLMAERFRERLPSAEVTLVEDANHLLFIDRTDLVAEHLRRFLSA